MKITVTFLSLAALVAFAFTQLSFQASVSLLFAAGLVTIACCDYSQKIRSVSLMAPAARFAGLQSERFRLAA